MRVSELISFLKKEAEDYRIVFDMWTPNDIRDQGDIAGVELSDEEIDEIMDLLEKCSFSDYVQESIRELSFRKTLASEDRKEKK